MNNTALTLFDTTLGRCGIAWGAGGLLAVSFAESSDDETIKRLRRRAPDAVEGSPSTEIRCIIDDVQALFKGEKRDLAYAKLDMSGITDFDTKVIEMIMDIKPGALKTYGDLARQMGDVSLSRRVGQALGRNPFPIVAPCHRVVGADGTMTGFSAPGGTNTKHRLLKIEGALAPDLFDL